MLSLLHRRGLPLGLRLLGLWLLGLLGHCLLTLRLRLLPDRSLLLGLLALELLLHPSLNRLLSLCLLPGSLLGELLALLWKLLTLLR